MDNLAEIALGWLGWSEAQLMESDINAIVLGYRGKAKMLQACFGSGKKDEPPKRKPKPEDVKSFANTHNQIRKVRA